MKDIKLGMRIVQIMGNGIEELWEFEDSIEDDQIRNWYTEWTKYEPQDLLDPSTFDEWMDEFHEGTYCNRIFVDEVYV